MNLNTPEQVPFELLHLELVSQVIHADHEEVETTVTKTPGPEASPTSRLELLGFNTGYRFIERLAKDYPKFKDELDLLKFICKDFWVAVFRKQIDNLRTNHQGVYVLQDNSFRFLSKASQDRQYLEASPKFVAFTCGLVRGSLANLGVNTVVTAEVTSMPACKFQVQVQRA